MALHGWIGLKKDRYEAFRNLGMYLPFKEMATAAMSSIQNTQDDREGCILCSE